MASTVEICNNALIALGAETIMALTENSKAARLCNARFASARDAVLRAHPWNCAMARTSLAQESSSPAFGYSYRYQLPGDCLRVIQAYGADKEPIDDWQVEGRSLLCDEATVYIKYIKRVTDPNQLDSLCREAISARLAAEIAYALTQSRTAEKNMWEIYNGLKLTEARAIDAQEGTPVDESEDSWLTVRG